MATPLGIRLFEQAGFNGVLIPYRNPIAQQDRPYELIDYLHSRPEWTLRMSSRQGVLFSRNVTD